MSQIFSVNIFVFICIFSLSMAQGKAMLIGLSAPSLFRIDVSQQLLNGLP